MWQAENKGKYQQDNLCRVYTSVHDKLKDANWHSVANVLRLWLKVVIYDMILSKSRRKRMSLFFLSQVDNSYSSDVTKYDGAAELGTFGIF